MIGRKKLRDSDLIRKLLKAGLTYRGVATIAKCSHGSVHAERVAMKKEEAAKRKAEEEALQLAQTQTLASTSNNDPEIAFPDTKAAPLAA